MVKNTNIAKTFLATKHLIGICKVNIDLHNTLNYSKGTIYAPCLNEIPESEIVENLKDQGVVGVYKFQKYNEGKAFPSGVVLLTFDSYYLPEKIEVSWYTTKVRAYYSNPMRCKSCQLLGHTTKRCQNTPACDACALPPHLPIPCTRIFCANCAGNHSASSRLCPKFKQMKEIIVIKTDNKCSMREAIRIHKLQIPPQLNEYSTSFSTVTKDNPFAQQNDTLISSPHPTAATNNISNITQQNNTKTSPLLSSSSNNIPYNPQPSDRKTSSPPLAIAENYISRNQQQSNTNQFSSSLSITTNSTNNNEQNINTNHNANLNTESNSHTRKNLNLSNQTTSPMNSVDDLKNVKSFSYNFSTLSNIPQSDYSADNISE